MYRYSSFGSFITELGECLCVTALFRVPTSVLVAVSELTVVGGTFKVEVDSA